MSIEVTVGQTVVWTNDDSAFHTVTSGTAGTADVGKEFDSGLTGPAALTSKGKTFEHTFDILAIILIFVPYIQQWLVL